MSLLLLLSVVACIATIYSIVTIAMGLKKMKDLGDVEIKGSTPSPKVSIIVPACNEQENIEKAILSLLDQNYEELEIIVVNDRSTDKTAEVLQRLQGLYPRITVLGIKDLPDGWMGKSHALASGAEISKGDYLVFTDADVVLEKTTISRAVNHVTTNRLDHLCLIFKNMTSNWLLGSLILDTGMGLFLAFRPWKVREEKSRFFIGVGAFNMVRKSTYLEIGGHESIRMHPIDDMMLGKIIKEHGYHQDCLLGQDFVVVPWYDSVRAMVNGLLKNMFAVVHYRLLCIPLMILAILVGSIFPFWGVIWGDIPVRNVCLVTIGVRLVSFGYGLKNQGLPIWYLPGAVISPYISCYIILKSACVTLYNGGISWRGQHYPLRELKKAKPLLF